MKRRIEGMTFRNDTMPRGLTAAKLYDCVFEEGSEALADSREIGLENCDISCESALWNVRDFQINDSRLLAPDAIRYAEHGRIVDTDIRGAHTMRECSGVVLHDCTISSSEFGWKCQDIVMEDCNIHAAYLLHDSRNLRLDDVEIRGDFSFQSVDKLQIGNSFIRSNEAFRHSKNVTLVDSVIQGGCIGWYSENLTLIGCQISGPHPLCHCKNLKLIDCVLMDAEQAFEGSDVKATIVGHLESVKNPLSGKILADSLGEVVQDMAQSTCQISLRA